MFQEELELFFHGIVIVGDRVAELVRGRSVVVASVNCTGPGRGPALLRGGIDYVGRWSFADMLIFKRSQYLPDLCNDLLYSGVRLLRKIRK